MIARLGPDDLLEGALTAWRPRATDGRILSHPSWADMGAADRRVLFEEALRLRRLEAGLDFEGLSTTSRSLMERVRRRASP